jgi:hypothetical protein
MTRRIHRLPRSLTTVGLVCSLIAGTVILGCAATDTTFPVVVGASMQSDIRPCADYASYYNYAGTPYHVVDPETGKVARRHEGIDFCTSSGSDVLASANGTVVRLVRDDPIRGGRVTIQTKIEYRDNARTETLHLDALHITPRSDLKLGDSVKAGQVIGYVEPPGKPHIGPRPHVHLSAGPTPATWLIHTDPNRFWQKGAGIVSCFDPSRPPGDQQIVAPIKCSR